VSLQAATFVVPPDRKLVRDATAIVIGSALTSRAEKDPSGFIETITTFSIEETIKGDVSTDTIDIVAPGGAVGDDALLVPGSPRFEDGERYLLFLTQSKRGWHVRDLVLGKFSFRTDVAGRKVLVRDERDIETPRGLTHQERRRAADAFVDFVRVASAGGPAEEDYDIAPDPLLAPLSPSTETTNRGLLPITTAAPFGATSYTSVISGSQGARWNVFPAPVTFTSVGTVPGAPAGGVTAITTSFASWNNEPNSNINYVYAGPDPGTHNNGLSGPDQGNTIAFEQDLSGFGAGPFQCSGSSYSGTLGIGGITSGSGTHTGPDGLPFVTTREVDVEMNKGLANCTAIFNNGDFNSGVAHEVGHTLGFRHSNQGREPNSACVATGMECSSSAIMTASVTPGLNAALQTWDQHAAEAVYPGATPSPAPAAPTGVNAIAIATNQVQVSWALVAGATSYQILRRGPGAGAFTQVGTATATATSFVDGSVTANNSYLYIVRAVNAGGTSGDSAPDFATTVIFTDDPLTAGAVIKAVHLAQLRTAVNALRILAGLAAATFTDAASPGVVVKAIHITQLRSRLNEARTALGFSNPGYTDPSLAPGTPIRAIHFQEIRNRVK
jgi:hypothetical protein